MLKTAKTPVVSYDIVNLFSEIHSEVGETPRFESLNKEEFKNCCTHAYKYSQGFPHFASLIFQKWLDQVVFFTILISATIVLF